MSRPALVLSSSLGTDRRMWDPLVPLLEPHFELLAYDMRGHGSAPSPPGPYEIADLAGDVLALLDERGVERAHWAGVSIGGMIGMWTAAHSPDRIDRLVVCCSSPHMPPPEAWEERIATVLAAGSTEPIADPVIDRWLTTEFVAAHPEVRARLRETMTSCDPRGYSECCGAIQRMDLRPDLGRIAAPTLVISAPRDLATPPEHQRAIADGIPGARLATLEDGAHLAAVERPGEVGPLIVDHLTA